jgi:hypothetical protein
MTVYCPKVSAEGSIDKNKLCKSVFCVLHVTWHRTGVARWTSFISRTVRGNLGKSHVLVGQTFFFPHLTTSDLCSFMSVCSRSRSPSRACKLPEYYFCKGSFRDARSGHSWHRTCVCLRSAFLCEDIFCAFYPGPHYGKKYLSARFTSNTTVGCCSGIYTERFWVDLILYRVGQIKTFCETELSLFGQWKGLTVCTYRPV